MDLSYICINRIVEEKIASDRKYRKEIETSGQPVLSQLKGLTDDQLTEHLRIRGVRLDRRGFEEWAHGFSSAEEMARSLIKGLRWKLRD